MHIWADKNTAIAASCLFLLKLGDFIQERM